MIEIRRAGPADGDALGGIHAAAWEAAYGPFFEPEFAAREVRSRRTRWHARVAAPAQPSAEAPAQAPAQASAGRGTILLAEVEGRPLALSVFLPSPTRPGLAEIATFYGHPDGWGTGVAAALMTETLRRLGDEGCAGAHLWTLRDTPRSRRFYAKCGFTETGATRTFDFGEGNLLAQVEYERTG
ncbi:MULTISPECIES: GNAT family N-acetyltransferase [Streptomyces]|uniref:GNAT family N-acetyltransferase n=1 Tax=Streptomyces TaxID=1883 RepID=UPI00055E6812|nr:MULTISPECIES: GNAT family N-acetyltransferase [Streptomyces]AKL69271.1 acetyltransferase [Streptomyces sp. Mg1]RPK32749.1 Acetyltransferase (GNAT) family protein [Streptomyces sp. ADI91-18]WBY23610.1 GNAT family N-acetyltransferase [Streptomyces goshikiensis]WSS02520.1 GNAT family N-acetyltransferase [Streptomyces goshikiensis]